MPSSELYVGNLDPDTTTQELKEIFERYGSLLRCDVKFAYSAAFGFVGFDFTEDAERAQRKEHGRSHRGRRLIVEFSKTTPGQGRRGRFTPNDRGIGRDRSRSRNRGGGDDGESRGGYKRRRSPSYSRRSSRDSDRDNDRNSRRNRDRSRSRDRSSKNRSRSRDKESTTNGNSKSKKQDKNDRDRSSRSSSRR